MKGSAERTGDSGSQAGDAPSFSLARVFSTFDFYVTAVRDGGGDEKLISWRLDEGGAVGRANDSGNDGLNHISRGAPAERG